MGNFPNYKHPNNKPQTFQIPNNLIINYKSQILISSRTKGIKKTIVFLLHFFVLIQRNEAKKNQGKPDRSARFALLSSQINELNCSK
jgi:hypothetical protein